VLTRVVNVRDWDRATLLADPDFVYVGRPCYGWRGSIWGNPFRLLMTRRDASVLARHYGFNFEAGPFDATAIGVETAVELYRRMVESLPHLRSRIAELRGKRPGCFCVDWEGNGEPPKRACHAVVLAQLANALAPEPEQASA
jgi:hypothetical protein